ncbi:MAG: GNAT family N-acetyltransferase [Bacteroidetes bacterium 4572_117]|nr:MAG: GNAT family N-acetyltransferase [Bacteroidetes bacterium 4572_117]
MSKYLQNNTIKLRALEPEDLELLYNWENDSSIWGLSNTLVPYSKFALKNYIENSSKDIFEAKQLRLIIELNKTKEAIGTIDLFDIDFYNSRAGVGILIAEKKHRKLGYAHKSLKLLATYVFEYLGLFQLYCDISEDNLNSLKLFESLGFKTTGKKEKWTKKGNLFDNVLFLQLFCKSES